MRSHLFEGKFGIERETLRVDSFGSLAQTPHPFGDDPHITRDFCENQIELVTPVCSSIDEALESLGTLDAQVRDTLKANGEHLWLYSNPPHFDSENEIPIAAFTGDHSSKRSYREYLEQKYGKKLMLFSGIHFNFSFSDEFLHERNTENTDFRCFRDALYLRLYKQLMRHSWLLVLLTAASPYYDASLDKNGDRGIIKSRYASMRNSERGYWNQYLPILDHSSLRRFTDSIRRYIKAGFLHSASELYLPVRLKPRGVNTLENLAEHGVDHIELRMFDLNPDAPLGIDGRDLQFAHLLMLYLLSLPDFDFTPALQTEAVQNHKNAALIEPDAFLTEQAADILHHMEVYFASHEDAQNVIVFERQKLGQNQINFNQIYSYIHT
jgi:glutamate--cysteine ligase